MRKELHTDEKILDQRGKQNQLPVKAKPFNHQLKAYEKVCYIFGFKEEVG